MAHTDQGIVNPLDGQVILPAIDGVDYLDWTMSDGGAYVGLIDDGDSMSIAANTALFDVKTGEEVSTVPMPAQTSADYPCTPTELTPAGTLVIQCFMSDGVGGELPSGGYLVSTA